MKIYTKTGDSGKTSLYDGRRVSKNCIIFDTLGELDELNVRIGVACTFSETNYLYTNLLRTIQCKIQDVNAIIATVNKEGKKLPVITEDDVKRLETCIDNYDGITPKLTKFILPGVTKLDAQLQTCRTQTRKVERLLLSLNDINATLVDEKGNEVNLEIVKVDPVILKYFNRLSDFFFSFARYVCHKDNCADCFIDDYKL
jgi:cob(I)alamin adenosyltransferase